ncbi:hypothetical protein GPECTOR_177g228 [Gonium pectorale]|uniref:14-3-3 domain-containing protein n=1 Tax=Gonium pectorale TaxID=33097 RepID=A0A150FX95_GONPE|nr:hypothetical protein GPECTOR_177g228 [Gonium pectorale]|eukprot:KXZ42233.1 hypothetical protein GPECTOR_177g228 [Gonium pectorale]
MKGDCHRYLAEYKVDEAWKTAVYQAMAAYTLAEEKACRLPPTNHIRLALALSFSIFYYRIVKEPLMACIMTKLALSKAVDDIDNIGGNCMATIHVMKRLTDNLKKWGLEMNGDGETQS